MAALKRVGPLFDVKPPAVRGPAWQARAYFLAGRLVEVPLGWVVAIGRAKLLISVLLAQRNDFLKQEHKETTLRKRGPATECISQLDHQHPEEETFGRTSWDGSETRPQRGGRFGQRPDSVRVCVTDAGPGIAVEKHERIFEKFSQIEMQKHSMGLGLTFCKLAVEAHGGQIGIDREVGKQHQFWVLKMPLPVSASSFPFAHANILFAFSRIVLLPTFRTDTVAELYFGVLADIGVHLLPVPAVVADFLAERADG